METLAIDHSQVNKAPTMWHRTCRALEQVNPHTSSPGHIEMVLTEKQQTAPKPAEEVAEKKKITQKKTLETKTYGPGVNSASNKC